MYYLYLSPPRQINEDIGKYENKRNIRKGIGKMIIYADNAATSKLNRSAAEAMLQCAQTIYGNPSSSHIIGRQAADTLLSARRTIADIFGCSYSEIYFTSGGSESDNQALLSAARIGAREGKKHIVSTAFEHHAVLHTLDLLREEGFRITLLDIAEDGILRADQLKDALCSDTALVSVMYANNEIGTIQPIGEIGELCRKNGVLFHTDAVQAAGHLPIDVKKDHIDLMSVSAHKFHGPKGIGVLYAREGIDPVSLIRGGAQERGHRAGTENLPAIRGMEIALKEADMRRKENAEKVLQLRETLIDGMLRISDTKLNGSRRRRLPSNANIIFSGVDSVSLVNLLSAKGICASAGSACTSGSDSPSHVLLSIGRTPEEARSSLRFSLSEENTPQEIDIIVRETAKAVSELRGMTPLWQLHGDAASDRQARTLQFYHNTTLIRKGREKK